MVLHWFLVFGKGGTENGSPDLPSAHAPLHSKGGGPQLSLYSGSGRSQLSIRNTEGPAPPVHVAASGKPEVEPQVAPHVLETTLTQQELKYLFIGMDDAIPTT